MTTLSLNYAAAASITITPASLADAGYRESTAVDNSSNKYVGALVGGIVRIGTVTADGYIYIYAYGTYDGTEYTAGVTGSDGTITWGTTGSTGVEGYNNLPLLGIVMVDSTDDDDYVRYGPFNVESAFGGVLPQKWGIVMRNATGAAFHATQTNSECQYMGIKADNA